MSTRKVPWVSARKITHATYITQTMTDDGGECLGHWRTKDVTQMVVNLWRTVIWQAWQKSMIQGVGWSHKISRCWRFSFTPSLISQFQLVCLPRWVRDFIALGSWGNWGCSLALTSQQHKKNFTTWHFNTWGLCIAMRYIQTSTEFTSKPELSDNSFMDLSVKIRAL